MESKTQVEEQIFLEGPQSRRWEFIFTIKVLFQFIRGFRKFHFLGPCATVFGSARYTEEHVYYTKAREIGRELAKLGFTVMTGGGPGIMEAANRGAQEAGGKSVGCNITLPVEQQHNPYLDLWVRLDYFFVRKVLLTKYSYAFVVMPGGYGTLDEFFEAVTLIQTQRMRNFPIVLFGREYHTKLYDHLKQMCTNGTIGPADLDLFLFTDSVDEVSVFLEKTAIQRFNLKKFKRRKSLKIFLEK